MFYCLFLRILHIEIQRLLRNFDSALSGVKGLITVKKMNFLIKILL